MILQLRCTHLTERIKIKYTMILYGASGHAKVIIDTLEALGKRIDWIVDDDANRKELLGYEVRRNTGKYDAAIIAIGNCQIRQEKVKELDVKTWETAVHPSAVVSPRACLGEGTVVMAGVLINACANVGRHCIVNTGASIGHDVEVSDFVHVAPHATLAGGVSVGEGTWIGAGSVVKQGIHIGKNCMIGAGSVVVKDIPDGVTAYGNPCRVMRYNTENIMNNSNLTNLNGGG